MCMQSLEKLPRFVYNNKSFYKWYEDNDMIIGFSPLPDVEQIKINKFVMTKEEIADIKAKPFLLKNTVDVYLCDKRKGFTYFFTINESFRYDGASIPSFAWMFIGSKGDVRFLIAALVHDVLCINKHYVGNDRYFADKVFERCCYVGGTCAFVRWVMFHSVDNWQKFQGW